MKPSDLIVVPTVGDAAEEGSAAKLHEAAQAAHDLMSKTLEVLDGKIKGLFNAQREQLAQVAERHQQMVKDKVRAFALAPHVAALWASPATSPTSAPTPCFHLASLRLGFVGCAVFLCAGIGTARASVRVHAIRFTDWCFFSLAL